jgi:hypothetical protein
LIRRRRFRGEHGSLVPVGGLFGMAAVLALPVQAMHRWFWLPAVADVGTVVYIVGLRPCVMKAVKMAFRP